MTASAELLTQMISSLPTSEDTDAATRFLRRPDLTRIIPVREELLFSPAEEFLRIYSIRQASTTEASIATYGFPLLLSALQKLQPTELLTIATFATAKWYGSFWLDQADRLVGFVLIERRSPEEEQERLAWFRQNLA